MIVMTRRWLAKVALLLSMLPLFANSIEVTFFEQYQPKPLWDESGAPASLDWVFDGEPVQAF